MDFWKYFLRQWISCYLYHTSATSDLRVYFTAKRQALETRKMRNKERKPLRGKRNVRKARGQSGRHDGEGTSAVGRKIAKGEQRFSFQVLNSQVLHAMSWMWFTPRANWTAVKFQQMNHVVFNKLHKANERTFNPFTLAQFQFCRLLSPGDWPKTINVTFVSWLTARNWFSEQTDFWYIQSGYCWTDCSALYLLKTAPTPQRTLSQQGPGVVQGE